MKIFVSFEALLLKNGKFFPKFHFMETQVNNAPITSYEMGAKSVCDSKKEALKHARVHALRKARKEYGKDVRLFEKKNHN